MARARTIEICELNITMSSPHNTARYVKLFLKAYQLTMEVERGRSDAYRLGALYDLRDAVENDELTGEIYRYTKIDKNSQWFNTETGQPADEVDTLKISIPENVQPNLVQIPFIFSPKVHRLWYVSRDRTATLGPASAVRFFDKLFSEVSREYEGFGRVEVTAVPRADAVDEMLAIHRITKLLMEFKRPNADDDDELERQILEKMEKRKVNRWRNQMTSSAEEGIVADDELKAEARVAADNGNVEVVGYDASGNKVTESTEKKPARHRLKVDDEVTTAWHALRQLVTARRSRKN